MSNLGRLIRTTNETCSMCGHGKLQIRALSKDILVDGMEIQEEEKYLACNKCDHEESYIDKKENKKKHREIKEVIEPKAKEVKYGKYKERDTIKGGFNRGVGRGNK